MHRDVYSADETVDICHALCSTKYIFRVVHFGACSERYMIYYFQQNVKVIQHKAIYITTEFTHNIHQ